MEMERSKLTEVLTLAKSHTLLLDLQQHHLIIQKTQQQKKKKFQICWLQKRRLATPIDTMTLITWLPNNTIWKLVRMKEGIMSAVISWLSQWVKDILIDIGSSEMRLAEVAKHQWNLLENTGTLMELSKNLNSTKVSITQRRRLLNVLMRVKHANVRVKFILVKELDQIMETKLRLSKIYFPLEDCTRVLKAALMTRWFARRTISHIAKKDIKVIGITSKIFLSSVGVNQR